MIIVNRIFIALYIVLNEPETHVTHSDNIKIKSLELSHFYWRQFQLQGKLFRKNFKLTIKFYCRSLFRDSLLKSGHHDIISWCSFVRFIRVYSWISFLNEADDGNIWSRCYSSEAIKHCSRCSRSFCRAKKTIWNVEEIIILQYQNHLLHASLLGYSIWAFEMAFYEPGCFFN